MVWEVAAGIIIAGFCLGLVYVGAFIAGAPTSPDNDETSMWRGIKIIAAGLMLSALVIGRAFHLFG